MLVSFSTSCFFANVVLSLSFALSLGIFHIEVKSGNIGLIAYVCLYDNEVWWKLILGIKSETKMIVLITELNELLDLKVSRHF
jgi:hypothetical protein